MTTESTGQMGGVESGSSPAPQSAPTDGAGTGIEPGPAGQDATEKPSWAPSYKFKVYDKEMEVPQDFRGYIKDEASEKRFRELFEKAYALDEHKQIQQRVLQNLDEYKGKASEYESHLSKAQDGLKRLYSMAHSDFGAFLETYKIPPEQVINYVRNHLAEQDLPEDERRQRDQWRNRAREASFYEQRMEEMQRENQSMVMTQHQASMQMTFSQPEIKSFATTFDQKFGEGAFQNHVVDYGNRVFNAQKRYIHPFEAAKSVMDYYGRGLQPTTPAAPTQQGNQTPPQPIPNVGQGGQATPTRRKFKNLDEMRKYVAENFSGQ